MRDPIQDGQELMLAGQYQSAQDHFLELLKGDPENDIAVYHLGLCHLAFDNLDEAENCFRSCLNINPANADALVDLGDLEFTRGDAEQSILSYSLATKINPEHGRAYTSLARVQESLGLNLEAVATYEKAMRFAEPGEEPAYDLALAYSRIGKYLKADLMLDNLITETLRRASFALLQDRENERAREELVHFIQDMREDRQEIQDLFYDENGYALDMARYHYQAQALARSEGPELARSLISEIRMLVYLGMEREGKISTYRLQNVSGSFSGQQLHCFLYSLERHLDPQLPQDEDIMGLSYREALAQF